MFQQKKGIIFDGFPRNIAQAEAFKSILTQNKRSLHKVIFLEISDKQVIERLTGRLYAPKSGLLYHIKNKPPLKEGICDVSGEALQARPDDSKTSDSIPLGCLPQKHKAFAPLL